MAKADTVTKKAKPKKQTRKPKAASAASADAASKNTRAGAGKARAKSKKPTGSPDHTGVRPTSKAPTEDKAQPADTQQQKTAPQPDAAGSGGALDPSLLPARTGKIGVFGGPKDRGIKPDDKLALPTGKHFTFERVRSLNPKSFYCAMRWDYHAFGKSNEEGKRWWANKKLLVTNPANGVSIVVRAVDFGPPESTGLSIAVSPGAAEALGVEVGDEVEIAFSDPRLPVGEVQSPAS